MLNITKNVRDDAVTLHVEGRLDTTTAPLLETELQQVAGVAALVLDLDGLSYISSAGLRVLLSAQKRTKGQGDMKVVNACEAVMEIFDVTGFSDILHIE